jgi:putative Holliday junction resolvase
MRPGVRLGVDVGSVRVGVATCDPAGILATPVETLQRGRSDLTRLTDLVTERDAVEVVVGLPTTLRGTPGPAAQAAEAYAGALAGRLEVPVRLVDERFSTVGAQRGLHASGVDTRRGRGVIDQAAAVIILQGALDAERSSGRPPGRIVVRPPRPDDHIPGHTTGDDSPGAEDEAVGRPVEGER